MVVLGKNIDALVEQAVKCSLKDDEAPESAGETSQEAERHKPAVERTRHVPGGDTKRREETGQEATSVDPPAAEIDDITMKNVGALTAFNRTKVIYKPKAVRTREDTRASRGRCWRNRGGPRS
jgi:hypothetical protein